MSIASTISDALPAIAARTLDHGVRGLDVAAGGASAARHGAQWLMPSTLVLHSAHTRARHFTQIPIASRAGWFGQATIATATARSCRKRSRRGQSPRALEAAASRDERSLMAR